MRRLATLNISGPTMQLLVDAIPTLRAQVRPIIVREEYSLKLVLDLPPETDLDAWFARLTAHPEVTMYRGPATLDGPTLAAQAAYAAAIQTGKPPRAAWAAAYNQSPYIDAESSIEDADAAQAAYDRQQEQCNSLSLGVEELPTDAAIVAYIRALVAGHAYDDEAHAAAIAASPFTERADRERDGQAMLDLMERVIEEIGSA